MKIENLENRESNKDERKARFHYPTYNSWIGLEMEDREIKKETIESKNAYKRKYRTAILR